MTGLFANSGDPDQTPHSVASDLGLHCLPITLLGVSRLQWGNNIWKIMLNKKHPNSHWKWGLFRRAYTVLISTMKLPWNSVIWLQLGSKCLEMTDPCCMRESFSTFRFASTYNNIGPSIPCKLLLFCLFVFLLFFFLHVSDLRNFVAIQKQQTGTKASFQDQEVITHTLFLTHLCRIDSSVSTL